MTNTVKMPLSRAVAAYIRYLDQQSPVVSNSHWMLAGLYSGYGKTHVDAEVARQFEARAAKSSKGGEQ